jgi:hypothetical protein
MNLRALCQQEDGCCRGWVGPLLASADLIALLCRQGERPCSCGGYSKEPARILVNCGTSTNFLSKFFAHWVGV